MGFHPFASAKGLGKNIGKTRGDVLVAKRGIVAGRRYVVEDFDDFLGDVIEDGWAVFKGSDGQTVSFAISAHESGMVRATAGDDAAATMAVNGVQLYKQLGWKANQGNLTMEARVRISAITNISLFVGFTDRFDALEMPINSAASANTLTSTATDAVGFMFDTSMTNDFFWLTGVKADTDATHINTGIAPVAATWIVLRVELDTSGNSHFYINDAFAGSVTDALTATVALAPTIAAFTRSAASATVDVDYVQILASRV